MHRTLGTFLVSHFSPVLRFLLTAIKSLILQLRSPWIILIISLCLSHLHSRWPFSILRSCTLLFLCMLIFRAYLYGWLKNTEFQFYFLFSFHMPHNSILVVEPSPFLATSFPEEPWPAPLPIAYGPSTQNRFSPVNILMHLLKSTFTNSNL